MHTNRRSSVGCSSVDAWTFRNFTSKYRNPSLVFLTASESIPKPRIMTVLNPVTS